MGGIAGGRGQSEEEVLEKVGVLTAGLRGRGAGLKATGGGARSPGAKLGNLAAVLK